MIKFGTGGFRGIIGEDFTKDNVQLVAQALCDVAKSEGKSHKPIVIGYDYRFMSDFFAVWISEVLAANGIKVLLNTAPMPTPAIMCATRELKNEYGIMLTASHNPYYYNGVKLFLYGGVDADTEFTNILESRLGAVKKVKTLNLLKAKNMGLIEDFCYVDQYLKNIKSFILPQIKDNNAKVLFDNMCGTGIIGLKKLAKDFDIKTFDIINGRHDAFFNFLMPNPTESALSEHRKKVIEGGYDYAIATDSDGDRLGVIDEKGDFVSSNDILGALYYYLIKYRNMSGDVVKNLTTSVLLDLLAQKFGYNCHEVDVGFKNISSKMRETDALIGGESSGGLTVRNYLFGKDSIFSASLFMEMQICINKPISQIIAQMHSFAQYDFASSEDFMIVENISSFDYLAKLETTPFETGLATKKVINNNIKYYFEDGSWAVIRASGTEPVLRLVAEAKTKEAAQNIIAKLKSFIETNLQKN